MLVSDPKVEGSESCPKIIITPEHPSTARTRQTASTPPNTTSTRTADILTTKGILNASFRKSRC